MHVQKLPFPSFPVKIVTPPLDLATPISCMAWYFSDRRVFDLQYKNYRRNGRTVSVI